MKGRKPGLENVIPMAGVTPREVPDAPEFMSSEGRKVWDELAPELVRLGRLEPHFTHAFAAYCESVSNFIAATHCVAVDGMFYVVKTRNGQQQKKTAAWGIQQSEMSNMSRLGANFGMSPVDDRRLGAGGQGDLFAEVLETLKNGSA
jgi:P27 family predicted phage terminase small subunit